MNNLKEHILDKPYRDVWARIDNNIGWEDQAIMKSCTWRDLSVTMWDQVLAPIRWIIHEKS